MRMMLRTHIDATHGSDAPLLSPQSERGTAVQLGWMPPPGVGVARFGPISQMKSRPMKRRNKRSWAALAGAYRTGALLAWLRPRIAPDAVMVTSAVCELIRQVFRLLGGRRRARLAQWLRPRIAPDAVMVTSAVCALTGRKASAISFTRSRIMTPVRNGRWRVVERRAFKQTGGIAVGVRPRG